MSSTIPANLATGVAINSTVTATFSEAMEQVEGLPASKKGGKEVMAM